METDDRSIALPAVMWGAMESLARQDLSAMNDQRQRELMVKHGMRTSLRLRDGSVKADVRITWDGCVVEEWYEEWGIRAEKYGPPRFAAEDIESWGYYERVRQPNWRHPFKKVKVWKVRVWADGQPGESATP